MTQRAARISRLRTAHKYLKRAAEKLSPDAPGTIELLTGAMILRDEIRRVDDAQAAQRKARKEHVI